MSGGIIEAAGLTRAEAQAWVGDYDGAHEESYAAAAQIKIISTLTAELDATKPLRVGDLVYRPKFPTERAADRRHPSEQRRFLQRDDRRSRRCAHFRTSPADSRHRHHRTREVMSGVSPAKREAIFARCFGRCELALDGCAVDAEQLHHLVKQEWGGRNALGNLRAVCDRCHRWVHLNEETSLALGFLARPGATERTDSQPRRHVAPGSPLCKPIPAKRCVADHPIWEFLRCTLPAGHDGRHKGLKGVHGGQVPMVWGEDATSVLQRSARGPVEIARHPLSRTVVAS